MVAVNTAWAPEQLERIDAADELQIAVRREDGTLRRGLPIWVVRVGDTVYVRTWYRRGTGWFGHVLTARRARVRVPGVEADVAVEDVGDGPSGLRADVDAAYRAKYGRYGSPSLDPMVADAAAASTLRLVPERPALACDLGPVLHRAVRDGAAHEAGVLPDALRRAVLEELTAETFTDLPAVEGPYGVRQEGEHRVFVGEDIRSRPAVHALHETVVAAVRAHAHEITGLGDWFPDEVAVQRYTPGSSGISAHRDGKRHRYLVAILTLEGSARLRQCSDREGTTARAWDADAGSLVLLRGPGLAGTVDDRPLHAVDGPRGHPRTSFTLRVTGS